MTPIESGFDDPAHIPMNPTADILAHLDAIDALAAKATKGPWIHHHAQPWIVSDSGDTENLICDAPALAASYPAWRFNKDFIAASRDGWPATVKALRVAVERMDSVLATWDSPRLDRDNMIRFVGVEMENMRNDLAAVRSLLKGEQPQ